MSRIVFALVFALVLSPGARADWPEFRGPTAQGLSDAKLPTEWGPTQNVAWKAAVPGKGWSSPVAAGGRVYLTTAVPQGDAANADLSLRALCLDAKTGTTIWDVEVFTQNGKSAPRIHSKNSHASATPVLHDGKLIVHFGHQGTACLDAGAGSKVWENRDLRYQPVHGNGGSPLVAGGKVFIAIDGTDRRSVVAYDEANGRLLWETKRTHPAKKAFSFGTPLLVTIHGRPMLISQGSDVISGYDPETGKELWSLTCDGYSVIPRPVFGHEMIYFSTGYDTPTLMAFRVEKTGDQFAAKLAWKTKEGAPNTPSPLLVGGELYLVSDGGLASCLDAKTGKVHWKERVPGAYSASPLYAGGLVYLQNETGIGTVLRAGKEFEVVAKNDLKERTLASYAVDGDALLIRTEKHLYRIGK